ncbi:MAG: hypothetical protein AAB492_03070 [Patescibacteria group bacterium]
MKPLEELQTLIEKYEALSVEAREVLDHLREWKRLEERDNAKRPWSALYSQCVTCGTSGHKRYQIHASKGRCARCYAKEKATEYRRAKGIQPLKKKVVSIPEPIEIPEKSKKRREISSWELQAQPVECFHCGMLFEEYEERVLTEADDGTRCDYHTECHKEAME